MLEEWLAREGEREAANVASRLLEAGKGSQDDLSQIVSVTVSEYEGEYEGSTSGVSRAKLLNQNNGEVAEWLKAAVC